MQESIFLRLHRNQKKNNENVLQLDSHRQPNNPNIKTYIRNLIHFQYSSPKLSGVSHFILKLVVSLLRNHSERQARVKATSSLLFIFSFSFLVFMSRSCAHAWFW